MFQRLSVGDCDVSAVMHSKLHKALCFSALSKNLAKFELRFVLWYPDQSKTLVLSTGKTLYEMLASASSTTSIMPTGKFLSCLRPTIHLDFSAGENRCHFSACLCFTQVVAENQF